MWDFSPALVLYSLLLLLLSAAAAAVVVANAFVEGGVVNKVEESCLKRGWRSNDSSYASEK